MKAQIEKRKHPRHLYWRVQDNHLLQYYSTIRGERYNIMSQDFGYKQTPVGEAKPYIGKISDKDLDNYLTLNKITNVL